MLKIIFVTLSSNVIIENSPVLFGLPQKSIKRNIRDAEDVTDKSWKPYLENPYTRRDSNYWEFCVQFITAMRLL